MTRGRGRLGVWAAAFLLVVVGAVVFWLVRDDAQKTPKSFCWGRIPAADILRLLPDGRYKEDPRDDSTTGELGYPEPGVGESCRVIREGGASPLYWAEYALLGEFDDERVVMGGLGLGMQLVYPLGNGLTGFVSDLGGVVEVPPCRAGDGPRYFQLIARTHFPTDGNAAYPSRIPVRPGNHVSIAEVLVRSANSIRALAGCSSAALPAAASPGDVSATAYAPGDFCGRGITGPAGQPRWTQRSTGPDPVVEDCIVWESPTLADSEAALRLELRHGSLAARLPADWTQGRIVARPHGAEYRADCANGSVHYRLQAGLNTPEADWPALLAAAIRSDNPRTGCVLPP